MQPHLTLFNIIMLIGAIQGFVIAGLIILNNKGNRQANLLLALILFVLAFDNLDTFFGDSLLDQTYPSLYLLSFSLYLAFGPLIYLYTLSLADPLFTLKPRHALHALPVVVDLVNYLSYFAFNPNLFVLGSGVSLQEISALAGDVGAIVSMAIYLFLSYSKARQAADKEYLGREGFVWLSKVYGGVSIQWLSWLGYFSYLFIFNSYDHKELRPYFLYAYLSILLYWFSIEGFLFSRRERQVKAAKKIIPLNPEMKQQLDGLYQLMEEQKPYLDQKITLNLLAEKLNVSPKLLSQLINTGVNKSFTEFINTYRVDEVKQRLTNPAYSHLSILGIALESGFQSKATFNRCFKEMTQMSPKEFQAQFSVTNHPLIK